MKSYKYNILFLIGVAMMIIACKKYEPTPIDKVTVDYVFDKGDSDAVNAQRFLLGVYADMRSGQNRIAGDMLDAASDDAVSSASSSITPVTILSTGAYSSLTLPQDENVWGFYYNGIRNATVFINNIGVVPTRGKVNGISLKYIFKSEARFLRALFYFELLKRYGGVPLLGNKVYQLQDNVALPRASFADCVKFIAGECDAIKDTLMTAPVGDNDSHRVTKGAALALKARVLLYAASPLFNGQNIDPQNTLTGYTDYDVNRWKAAAGAASELINLNTYKLVKDYRDISLIPNNSEIIFMQNGNIGTSVEGFNAPIGFPPPVGGARTSPTQELVDSYTMINGLAITDPASGYSFTDPYGTGVDTTKRRDPRLTYNVFYNGSPWLNQKVETFEGGQSKPNIGTLQTITGYYMHKFMGKFENTAAISNHNEDWIFFRYAGILLDYAEAENEVDGPNGMIAGGAYTVYGAIDTLRKRAGIIPGTNKRYGIKDGISKEDMRELIRNERRAEFAFEESRYFDIRRWKIAETVMNQPRGGILIVKSGTDLTYSKINVLNTKFIAPKMYLYPIPYDEVVKNKNMKQNPGWQ